MTILDQLTGCARERTVQAKLRISLEELKQQALSLPKGNFTFEKAIKKPAVRKRAIAFTCLVTLHSSEGGKSSIITRRPDRLEEFSF